MSTALPKCGLYRTTAPVGDVQAGRLVYFHNHGDPGPGIYFPDSWSHNRAHFAPNGMTLPEAFDARTLFALPQEGFYRVKSAFTCCAKNCVKFEPETFVQLGYNGEGRALVFLPELASGTIEIPDRGVGVDDSALSNLVLMRILERRDDIAVPRGIIVH